MAPVTKKTSSKTKAPKTQTKKFVINASGPSHDKIFNVDDFLKFLVENIKINGRKGNLGDSIVCSTPGDGKVEVVAHIHLSGRYLKYLTKKFLKRNQLRDWLRVVSTSSGVYELKFFNVAQDQEADDDE